MKFNYYEVSVDFCWTYSGAFLYSKQYIFVAFLDFDQFKDYCKERFHVGSYTVQKITQNDCNIRKAAQIYTPELEGEYFHIDVAKRDLYIKCLAGIK